MLFITACTDAVREAYRRALEVRETHAALGRRITVVLGGPHASAVPEEGRRSGLVETVVAGEGERTAAEHLGDVCPVKGGSAPIEPDGSRRSTSRPGEAS